MTQTEKDLVTVGEIRKYFEEKLDDEINTLKKLIKKGYSYRHECDSYLQKTIYDTLKKLDDLNTYAGLPNLIKSLRS